MKSSKIIIMDFTSTRKYDYYEKQDFKGIVLEERIIMHENM